METQWKSSQMYEHPAKHRRGTYGVIELSKVGVYVLKVGGGRMSCPQDWATKIHKAEQDEAGSIATLTAFSAAINGFRKVVYA